MSTLQPFLLVSTVALVGVCARVCARLYARHREALPSDGTMVRLRRAAASGDGVAPEVVDDFDATSGNVAAADDPPGGARDALGGAGDALGGAGDALGGAGDALGGAGDALGGAGDALGGTRDRAGEGRGSGAPGLRPLEEKVIAEVLGARNRPLAVLALNELTAEVSLALQDARTLPVAVGRIALLGGTALGLTAMATALRNEQGGTAAMWGGACVLLAVVGAGVCGVYGRLARRAAERRRDQTRELIRLLERRLPST